MKQLSVRQYQDAIRNILIPRQIETLQILYNQPNASATAKKLTEMIDPSGRTIVVSSFRIGKIGKAIAKYCNVVPGDYFDGRKKRPAYFTVISKIYDRKIGWTMYKNLQIALENLGLTNKSGNEVSERLTTEMLPYEETQLYKEGKLVQVLVDRYERNQEARIECLKHFGVKCRACGFDFEKVYGEIASSYIHVHHINQLADIKKEYNIDPINGLVPVCANCHSVIHMTRPAMTIEEIKKLIKKNNRP